MRSTLRSLAAAAVPAVWAALAVPAAAQVTVSLRPLGPVEALYVADLLPGSTGSRPDFLGITLFLDGTAIPPGQTTRAPSSRAMAAQAGRQVPVVLELKVAREDPSPIEIFRGTTDAFVLDQPVRHVTLRELSERGHDVSITQSQVNDDAVEGAVRNGRLPAGTYLFTITLRSPDGGGELASDDLRLTVGSPTRVELLSPGAPADEAPPAVVGPTPRFVWSADGEGPGARYRLRVVRVDDAGGAVEAVQSGYPSWEATVLGTSALYPASVEALRLEPGVAYAWQVVREVQSSGGVERVESPVYWFRVAGPGQRTGAGALDQRFAALLRALGLTELDGFVPVGATLEDGRPLSLQTLEELLTAVVAGEVPLLSVRVR
ncbi:MAG TPA: hypothetical protein VFQ39_17435 [Longimicrobium sp.]|nr:hypothetical protein [Longimicrobium sp.]